MHSGEFATAFLTESQILHIYRLGLHKLCVLVDEACNSVNMHATTWPCSEILSTVKNVNQK